MTGEKSLDKSGGVALWRRVADDIRLDINGGRFIDGGKLPTEGELAARFDVNRHTVRRALAVLEEEGIVRAEQGRGRFVHAARRLSYPIGRRTRFSAGLAGQASDVHGEILESRIETPPLPVSKALGLTPATRVLRMESLSFADGRPLTRATTWTGPASRFHTLADDFRELGSMTASLSRAGVTDYTRQETRISARYAESSESHQMGLAPGAVLLVGTYVNRDQDNVAFQYTMTRFAADRVELVVSAE